MDFPSHWSAQTLLLPASSMTFRSTMGRAKCDTQPEQIPLWDGLNLQALVLDSVPGQLDPLSLSALLLLHFLFSVFCPPLGILVFTSSNMIVYSISIHGFLSFEPMPAQFLFHLCQFTFCSCAWSSLFSIRMNVQGVAMCPHTNSANLLIGSFLQLRHGCILPPPWRSNEFQIPLIRGLIPYQFFFLHRAQSQSFDLGSSGSNVICTSCVVDLLNR